MASVVQMQKRLSSSVISAGQQPDSYDAIEIRQFDVATDIGPWLHLRDRAFAYSPVGVRSWNESDFEGEFLQKNWWQPKRMWVATPKHQTNQLLGSVTWAMRKDQPVVHWLLVSPRHRRQGIATALMQVLEEAVANSGYQQIELETHARWESALAFYQSRGYRILDAQ